MDEAACGHPGIGGKKSAMTDARTKRSWRGSLTGLTWGVVALFAAMPVAFGAPPGVSGIHLRTVLSLREQVQKTVAPKHPVLSLSHIRTIVIDPGHGGENQGAIGCAQVHEKFLTMELAYLLRDELRARYPGTKVVMTRYWDRSMKLNERMHRANLAGADLFLSLHFNAATHGRATGVETYFLTTEQALSAGAPAQSKALASTATGGVIGMAKKAPQGPEQRVHQDAKHLDALQQTRLKQHRLSGELAQVIQSRLIERTGAEDRGVKQANFGVLRGALMPAVVIEAGFLTHPEEGQEVVKDTYHEHVVQGLMEAVEAFDLHLGAEMPAPNAVPPKDPA